MRFIDYPSRELIEAGIPPKGDVVMLINDPDQRYRVLEKGMKYLVCQTEPWTPEGGCWLKIQFCRKVTPEDDQEPVIDNGEDWDDDDEFRRQPEPRPSVLFQ